MRRLVVLHFEKTKYLNLKIIFMKKLKTYIYFLFLQIILFGITISPNTLAGELENKAQEHVTSYYVNDIFADLELQIKQKIISDV